MTLPVFAGSVFSQVPVRIEWQDGKAIAVKIPKGAFVPPSMNDDPGESLTVRLQFSASDILGRVTVNTDTLTFTPLWPFSAGLEYKVLWRSKVMASFKVPEQTSGMPLQVRVFPTSNIVPANLLKIYLKFSEPMTVGRSYSYLALTDEKGDTLHDTFLEMEPELWSNDQTQLTVWLDPGRIKRDLVLNQALGNPLTSGKNYTLTISGSWKAVSGSSAGRPMVRHFTVSDFDRVHPAVSSWKVYRNNAGKVLINFGEPMDFAVSVEGINIWLGERRIEGSAEVIQEEQSWIFTPRSPLVKGNYTIKVDSKVEDLAGNNLNRLFDTDLQNTSERSDTTGTAVHEISFRVD